MDVWTLPWSDVDLIGLLWLDMQSIISAQVILMYSQGREPLHVSERLVYLYGMVQLT